MPKAARRGGFVLVIRRAEELLSIYQRRYKHTYDLMKR
jgi:hypothetical protein